MPRKVKLQSRKQDQRPCVDGAGEPVRGHKIRPTLAGASGCLEDAKLGRSNAKTDSPDANAFGLARVRVTCLAIVLAGDEGSNFEGLTNCA